MKCPCSESDYYVCMKCKDKVDASIFNDCPHNILIRCDYCNVDKGDTKKCLLKDGSNRRAKWNPKEKNICKKCREWLNGLFKYVTEE